MTSVAPRGQNRGELARWTDPTHGPRFVLTEGLSDGGRWVRPLNNPRHVIHAAAADVEILLTRDDFLALLNAIHVLTDRQGEPFGPKLATTLAAQVRHEARSI